MELNFEIFDEVGAGTYPDVIDFPNSQAQLFFIDTGILNGMSSNEIRSENWEEVTFQEPILISPDENMTNFSIGILPGFGIVGSYKTPNTHKMIIYEFAFEMERYLNSGSIKYSMDTPITSFTLDLENPINENPEHEGNVAISEQSSLLSPGSKVSFEFSMGDSEPYLMGIFYVDRSNFSLLNETISVDGRNIIGKALNDQTFDEENAYPYSILHELIKEILEKANIIDDKILVENTSVYAGYQFDVSMPYIEGISEILKATDNWQIKELVDGTVVIGSSNYTGFTSNSSYTFYRDKDIFTRSIVRDDQEAYRKVCVHNQDFKVYKEVQTYSGWNLQVNKTLYVNIPEGTTLIDAQNYADQIANSLCYVGKIESFTGPFRPQLIIGDEANIIGDNGLTNLGLITEITHRFGKGGFYTDFVVDSGGRLGKGRLSDYIGKITKDKTSSSRIYE